MSLCVYFDKRCSSFLSFTNNFPCYSVMQIFGCFARSLLMQTVSMAIYWKLPWKRTFQRISDTLSKLLYNISFRKRVTNLYKISEMSRVTKSYSPATAWWKETKPRSSKCKNQMMVQQANCLNVLEYSFSSFFCYKYLFVYKISRTSHRENDVFFLWDHHEWGLCLPSCQ